MKLLNDKSFWNYVMLAGLILILISGIFFISEFVGAKVFCKSIDGNYSFNFTSFEHFCNQKPIFQYQEGWNFDKIIGKIDINLTNS